MTPTLRAHLCVLTATLLVGGSFVASGKLSGTLHPFSLTLLRFVAAAALLAPVVLSRAAWRGAVWATLPRAAVMALFYSAFFACLFEALETTTALNTSALYTLVPFATALLCLALFRQRITARQLAVYLLGTAATCWVVFGGDLELMRSFALRPGDGLFMLGAACMCGYAIAMKALYRDDALVVLVFGILVSGAVWMALGLALSGQALEWELIAGDDVLLMAYLVVGATLGTVPLYQSATLALGPTRVVAYTYLTPGLVAALAWALDGTPIAPALLPGIALSALATILLQRQPAAAPSAGGGQAVSSAGRAGALPPSSR